ncbi:MAG: CRISPR-associated endonuclease Cas2 [Chloroflexi bacterium]|nr:CRISPR-associated endonuclease Cas2 [Chloroflexota bacterium]MCI0728537.1 CRISPR-associated endonuclease Cas2 [Chloroflexota bacterium]
MRIVVSYDITSDKRRTKIAKIMEGYGYRVQYSVFECDLDDEKLKELWKRLKPLVSTKEWESVRFYPLYSECAEKVRVLGKDLARFLGPTSVV